MITSFIMHKIGRQERGIRKNSSASRLLPNRQCAFRGGSDLETRFGLFSPVERLERCWHLTVCQWTEPDSAADVVGSFFRFFARLAPLRPAETLPIAHESLASIQLRTLPMIERFGQFLPSPHFSQKREGVRDSLRGACCSMRPDHERSVSHQD